MFSVSPIWTILRGWFLLALLRSSTYTRADEEEDAYIEAFGNSNETSGIWQAVRDIASDAEKMNTLCKRAHKQMGLGAEDVIDKIKFEPKLLSFHNFNESTNRRPILADVVSYGITRQSESGWYFTKGTKSDCVFYLMMWDAVGKKFRLGLQFCGVHIPLP